MEGQTSLIVEIVVPKDVWISEILSGNKILMVAWLFIKLDGWKVGQVKKTPPPGDNVILEPRWNRVKLSRDWNSDQANHLFNAVIWKMRKSDSIKMNEWS